jgi:hypothetical protein
MGMKMFFENERIRAEWLKELKTDSYYGLDLRREIKQHSQDRECPKFLNETA